MSKKNRKRRPLLTLAVILLDLGLIAAILYLCDYCPADRTALAALESTATVTVQKTEDGHAFLPEEPVAGFIFYPGGKVDHTAYAPLMQALAAEDVLCVLTDMPLRLAVLDMNAADGIAEKYPQVTRWSVGGHSLGGAMAASYAAKHGDTVDGLVLLAAYATGKLPEDMAVAVVTGTQDTVMNREKYESCLGNLPESTRITVLEGGNHAQFGSYGPQDGDTDATIAPKEQLRRTVEAILPVITGN